MVATQWKLGVSLVLVSAVAFAQEGITTGSFPVERRNVVTVSIPIQGLGNPVAIEGERVLGERFSVGLGVFASFTHDRTRYEDAEASGREGSNRTSYELGLSPGVRFYLTGRAPQGLWLSPRLEVGVGRSNYETLRALSGPATLPDSDSDNWSIGGTAVLGYSVVLEPGFCVQGGVGLGARRSAVAYDTFAQLGDQIQTQRVHQSSWILTQRLVLNLGVAF
jgi:hypothetical protein